MYDTRPSQPVEVRVRKAVEVLSFVWAMVGGAIALSSLGEVNPDVRVVVGVLSILGPVTAVGAGVAIRSRRPKVAGLLLVLSAVSTPTYFVYVASIPALVVGATLLFVPTRSLE
jgi:hypothetical protein